METKIKPWTTLSRDYLISRPWLTARRDCVQLPDGRINDEYYVLEYPDWVNVIALTPEGKYVMVRQYRYALKIISTELVAGVIEKGEAPLAAAQRELMEETGYSGGEWQELMTIAQNPGSCNNLTHCFFARGVRHTGTQHLDATEDVEQLLLTEDELRQMLINGDFKQALMLAPLWRYFALNHLL